MSVSAEQSSTPDPNAAFLTVRGWHKKVGTDDRSVPRNIKFKGVREWSRLPSQKRMKISDDDRDIYMSAGDDFQVPSGLLVGLWTAETGRLTSRWTRKGSWVPASRQRKYGSRCVRHYGKRKCMANWRALVRICQQKRGKRRICNPYKVYGSRAIALGRMQHLAKRWSPAKGVWGDHVVDYDGDDVYDPHDPDDAVATSARHIRIDYDEALKRKMTDRNAWLTAVSLYRGGWNRDYTRRVYRAWQ
ncbi:MAG: hypothetical protein U9Q03_00255, partial [Patescibacteria group bacterium]|nr:hypothetical protein [Patescibacteria group bacterium]